VAAQHGLVEAQAFAAAGCLLRTRADPVPLRDSSLAQAHRHKPVCFGGRLLSGVEKGFVGLKVRLFELSGAEHSCALF